MLLYKIDITAYSNTKNFIYMTSYS